MPVFFYDVHPKIIDLAILFCFIIVLFLIANINSAVFFWIIIVKKHDDDFYVRHLH